MLSPPGGCGACARARVSEGDHSALYLQLSRRIVSLWLKFEAWWMIELHKIYINPKSPCLKTHFLKEASSGFDTGWTLCKSQDSFISKPFEELGEFSSSNQLKYTRQSSCMSARGVLPAPHIRPGFVQGEYRYLGWGYPLGAMQEYPPPEGACDQRLGYHPPRRDLGLG